LNTDKHGIDFKQAQLLWDDAGLIILPSQYPSERRYLAIGVISEKYWTAVFTERMEKVRLISVRRSRNKENELYGRNQ
jgi:uncharacterized DUF497 family protein